MSTYKNTSGDYRITVGPTLDGNGTGTLTVSGNLNVVGNVTYIETSDLKVDDPFITVAANNVSSPNPAHIAQMGMVAQTGNATFAGLRFNTVTNDWEISPSVQANGAPISSYNAIAAGQAVAGNITEVQYNGGGGVFAASPNYTFDYTNNRVIIQGSQVLGNLGTAPTSVANTVSIYNNTVGSGQTGLYVISSSVSDELISATKARLYSLIY